ncbi:SPINDLE AND KINETOCHORE-ASSOCIATED PROTEIN 3 [Salix koriyanagi]|uniref:SPINDLE AND KINETOCHORE-ASSOCIATED PROTEIN 3 n=1 Tax=Salix koriyanagi TaxID=2511006 RepID=A0A9Q0X5T0_9ROSI|nr:SPINDLE AND KINETOCHORE-ASSOCIATED PROTEIN 3 [Salix koriyanagi]
MEETISEFSKSIGSFCNHLQSSCDALKQSIDRRPIPLDSASSTYIQCLNRRVASASSDLNLLESMAFGTVSFEELLGHCNEVYKSSENRILEFQDRLRSFGYVPAEVEIDDEADLSISMELGLNLKDEMDPSAAYNGPVSVASSIMKSLEEDPLMDESLSLKSLGLSDVCLATLAAEANSKINDPDISMRDTKMYYGDKLHNMKSLDQNTGNMELIEGELKPAEALRAVVKASKDDYESLPSYMKSLTSWEDLLAAVEKINSSLKMKDKTKGNNYFRQDEITSMDLGPKARTYLLLLTRMNQLAVETVDGLISYKVL